MSQQSNLPNSLNPERYFTADAVRFTQSKADLWITKANEAILAALLAGEKSCKVFFPKERFSFTAHTTDDVLQQHFTNRGFIFNKFNAAIPGQTTHGEPYAEIAW